MAVYKIVYSGYAYVEADDIKEAESNFFNGNIFEDSQWIEESYEA